MSIKKINERWNELEEQSLTTNPLYIVSQAKLLAEEYATYRLEQFIADHFPNNKRIDEGSGLTGSGWMYGAEVSSGKVIHHKMPEEYQLPKRIDLKEELERAIKEQRFEDAAQFQRALRLQSLPEEEKIQKAFKDLELKFETQTPFTSDSINHTGGESLCSVTVSKSFPAERVPIKKGEFRDIDMGELGTIRIQRL